MAECYCRMAQCHTENLLSTNNLDSFKSASVSIQFSYMHQKKP